MKRQVSWHRVAVWHIGPKDRAGTGAETKMPHRPARCGRCGSLKAETWLVQAPIPAYSPSRSRAAIAQRRRWGRVREAGNFR